MTDQTRLLEQARGMVVELEGENHDLTLRLAAMENERDAVILQMEGLHRDLHAAVAAVREARAEVAAMHRQAAS